MESVIKHHQVAIYGLRSFPLLYDDDTDLMTDPWTQLLHIHRHISQSIVVDPASENLIDLRNRLPKAFGSCSLS